MEEKNLIGEGKLNWTGFRGVELLSCFPYISNGFTDSRSEIYLRFYRRSIAYNYVSQTRFQSKLSKVLIYCRPQKGGGGYSPLNVDENPKGWGGYSPVAPPPDLR